MQEDIIQMVKESKMSRLEIAKEIGMHYSTLGAKLNGFINFKISELLSLRHLLEQEQQKSKQ